MWPCCYIGGDTYAFYRPMHHDSFFYNIDTYAIILSLHTGVTRIRRGENLPTLLMDINLYYGKYIRIVLKEGKK